MGLEIFQNFHEIFKYFKLKYFIVHLWSRYATRRHATSSVWTLTIFNISLIWRVDARRRCERSLTLNSSKTESLLIGLEHQLAKVQYVAYVRF